MPKAVRNPVQGLCSDTASRRGTQLGDRLVVMESDILSEPEPVSAWQPAQPDR